MLGSGSYRLTWNSAKPGLLLIDRVIPIDQQKDPLLNPNENVRWRLRWRNNTRVVPKPSESPLNFSNFEITFFNYDSNTEILYFFIKKQKSSRC